MPWCAEGAAQLDGGAAIFHGARPLVHRYLELTSTPAVQAARRKQGVGDVYAAVDGRDGGGLEPATNTALTEQEMRFIGQRDSFYLASVSETGWPYVQHRGGPRGFIRTLDPNTLIYPDFSGNQQLLTAGNVSIDPRVALIFMDYPNQRRLKVMGRLKFVPINDSPYLAAQMFSHEDGPPTERIGTIQVEAFDWNCPRHITQRYTAVELAPLTRRISALEAENAILQARLAALTPSRP